MTARFRLFGAAIAIAAGLFAGAACARDLVIGTNPPGSVYERASAAIAALLRDGLGVAADIRHFAGPAACIAALGRDEVQLALVLAADLPPADAPPSRDWRDIRMLAAVLSLPFGIAVAADSPVRRIADLKGMRVSAGFADHPAVARLAAAVLANGGLVTADIVAVPVRSLFEGTYRLGEGRIDAAMTMPGIHALRWAVDRLAARGGVRFVPFDTTAEAVAAMRRLMPVAVTTVTPDAGIAVPTPLAGYPVFLAAHAGLDPATAQQIVTLIARSLDRLKADNRVFRYADRSVLFPEAGVPYHPGAVAAMRTR
jgi:TRAP transporter TAXI family solute receptor